MGKAASFILVWIFSGASAGCQHFERARECRAVAKLVNPVLKSVDEARRKNPADPMSYHGIGSAYDRLAIQLVAYKAKDKRVQEAIADYQKLAKEASHDAHFYADALLSRDEPRLLAARAAAGRTLKHETGAVAHLEGVCRGK